MTIFQRSLGLVSTFFLLNTGCKEPGAAGQAGFLSTDVRLVSPDSSGSKKEPNPILMEEQVINASSLFAGQTLPTEQNITAWKGERVHVQLALKSNPTQEKQKFSIQLSPLVNKSGDSIAVQYIQVRAIGSVITDEYHGGCGHRPDHSKFSASRVTDPLLNENSILADSTAYFWVTVQVPADAATGLYETKITTSNRASLSLKLEVTNRQLPPPSEWAFGLDLWQHPAAIARVHNVALWSKEHYEKMRPYYEALAAAGQKKLTASIVHEPWGHQTYDDFPSLIKWTKKSNGSWSFDFSRFDEYIEFVMSCGINELINCYTIIPWKMQVRYYDEALQQDTTIATEINSPAYKATWKPMLEAFTKHLKEKKWFDITTIAMDERPMPAMITAISLLKSIDPNWKIALAGDYHPEIEKDIFDYCVASNIVLDSAVLSSRKLAGKPTTVYTCCTENYPNGFTFSPPAEHVYLGWYAQAQGFTGYLRWAFNSWTKDPLEDSRYITWPAGDTYQIYPGPTSSIRFEKLVEGVQDFEKIRLLKEEWTKQNQTEKLAQLKTILAKFKLSEVPNLPNKNIAALVASAKEDLRKLEN